MDSNIDNEHEKINLLLPWYINNTLNDDELSAVKHHLSACFMCNKDLL